jgi:hypothetical protein
LDFLSFYPSFSEILRANPDLGPEESVREGLNILERGRGQCGKAVVADQREGLHSGLVALSDLVFGV